MRQLCEEQIRSLTLTLTLTQVVRQLSEEQIAGLTRSASNYVANAERFRKELRAETEL